MASPTEILSDPGAYSVEEVVAAMSKGSPGDVTRAQALEAQGQNRKGIADFTHASARPESSGPEPKFSRERVLGDDGPVITGVSRPVIAGALHGDDTSEFTREQITDKVKEFLARPVQQPGEEDVG